MPMGSCATIKGRNFRLNHRKNITGLLLPALMVLSLGACNPDNSAEEATLHIKRSQAYEQQGQYRAAILEARNAVRLDPGNTQTIRQLATVYNTLGYYRSTLKLLGEDLTQRDPDAMMQKATAYNALQKYRSSLELLSQRDISGYSEAQLNQYQLLLGEALLGAGKTEEGLQALQQASGAYSVRAQLVQAHFAAMTGKVDDAEAIVGKLLKEDPQNAEALLLAGQIAAASGDFQRAEDTLSDALSYLPTTDIMLPQRITNLQLLSRVLTMRGRAPEAMIYNRILAESLPGVVENRNRIDESAQLIKEGKLDEAEKQLNAILEQGDSSRAGVLLGIVNYLKGDVSEASALLSENMDPETANAGTLEMLVSAKLQLNEIDQVIAILGPEVQSRAEDPALLGLYGLALLAKSDVSGEDYVVRSLALKPDNTRLRLALARFYLQQGKETDALAQLRQAYAKAPDDPMVQETLVRALAATGQRDEAVKLASTIAKANPDDARALTLAGLTLLQSDQREAGVAYLQKAVKVDEKNASAWLWLARVALQDKDFENAKTYFRHAIKIAPAGDNTYKGLISAYEGAGEADKGLAEVESYAQSDPANGIPMAVLAEFYLLNRKPEQAQEHIDEALKRQPQHAYIDSVAIRTYTAVAKKAIDKGDVESARRALSMGLSYSPNAVPLLATLADIEVMQGNVEAALKIATTLEPKAPGSALEIRGDVVFQEEPAKALSIYTTAWAIQPTAPLAHKIFYLLKRTDAADEAKAEAFTRQWAAAFPSDPVLLFNQAVIAQSKNDTAAAKELYEKLLKVAPTHVSALNNLAWLHYTDKRYDKALPLAQRASELAPENAPVLDTYGMILLASGKASDGIKTLERAHELAPDSDEIRRHLEEARKR